ncbi:MAG: HipA domain-containing protein [Slackia sp.]|nr:HipA domain-containing protein [Slackia sp.]
MDAIDLNECARSYLYYGGAAGRKEGILIDGQPWIAKFPRTARDMKGKHLPSCTSSPVSEYLGSHIYASLGIPVHETMLGFLEGKIVCACKDFCNQGTQLVEFKNLKNSTPDDMPAVSGSLSDGDSTYLSDVLASIALVEPLRSTQGVIERFWDMFVVDAFIKNPDRNNGNWGLLRTADGTFSLAPVYDNGSCLFSKRTPSVAAARLEHDESIEQDAFGTNVSCYRIFDSESRCGHAIHPFDYMRTSRNPDLAAAVVRFAETVDISAIDEIIDSVPEEAYGTIVMSENMRASHKTLLRVRLERGIVPAAEVARKLIR